MGIGIKETESTTQLYKQSRCESEKTRTKNCMVLDPLNTNRLILLFSQVINLGKLFRSRLTQVNHIIEIVRKINNTII